MDYQNDPKCDNILRVYRFNLNNTRTGYKQYKVTILKNKGYFVTWLPEFYPYVCNDGFDEPMYVTKHALQYYMMEFTLHPLISENEGNSLHFYVYPPFPNTVTLNSHTGDISGYFVLIFASIQSLGLFPSRNLFIYFVR